MPLSPHQHSTPAANPKSVGLLQRKNAPGARVETGGKNRLGARPELKVSQPGDLLEREADRVSSRVLERQPVPADVSTAPPQIQRVSASPASITSDSASVLAHAGTSRSMPDSVRGDFESRFGHDFSDVRIHTDQESARSARSFQARAYTLGNHIVFGNGEFSPFSTAGRSLLAHELTHVLQQRRGANTPDGVVHRKPMDESSQSEHAPDEESVEVEDLDTSGDFKPAWLDKAIELLTTYGAEVGEAAIGLIPGVGDLYDVVTAIIGETLISREKLDPLDRVLSLAGLIPIPGVSGKVLRWGRGAVEWTLKRLNVNIVKILQAAIRKGREILLTVWLRVHPVLERVSAKARRSPAAIHGERLSSGLTAAGDKTASKVAVKTSARFIDRTYSKSFSGVPANWRKTVDGRRLDGKLRKEFRDTHEASGDWDVGHIFPADWGPALGETIEEAAGDVANVTVQNRSMNRGTVYRKMERAVADYLRRHPDQRLDISISTRTRKGDSNPISRSVRITDAKGTVPEELASFVTNSDMGELHVINAFTDQLK